MTDNPAVTSGGTAAAVSPPPPPAAVQSATSVQTDAPAEQMVPLSRLTAVVAQKNAETAARQALDRELRLANDTLEEYRRVGGQTSSGTTTEPANRTTAAPNDGKAMTTQEIQALVSEEARRQNFAVKCNAEVEEGRKAHADFDKIVLGDLASVSPTVDQRGRPVLPIPLVEAAMETGLGHQVLYALGGNIAEATRIMGLSPTAQAVELTRLAAKLQASSVAGAEEEGEENEPAAPPNVSRAPAPVAAPRRNGVVKPAFSVYDTEHFSTEDWIKNREKQVEQDRTARARR